MNNCKGKTKENKKCKRKCKGKYCFQHQKKGGVQKKVHNLFKKFKKFNIYLITEYVDNDILSITFYISIKKHYTSSIKFYIIHFCYFISS